MRAAALDRSLPFLAGGGALGAMMRTRDWTGSPIGPPQTWPDSLRISVSTCLNCTFPILIWWGADLVKLYNDAYATILGEKHPGALGTPGREVWPEIWDTIGPMLERVLESGEATAAEDLCLILHRHGYPEECYFSFSYSPIRDQAGRVVGVFCPVIETTRRVLAERRAAFLLELDGRLRDLSDPAAIKQAASAMLGAHLGADQVGYAEVTRDDRHMLVEGDWSGGAIPSVAGLHRLDDYGAMFVRALRKGEMVRIDDVARDPLLAEPDVVGAFEMRALRAVCIVPLVKAGNLVATLFIHHARARGWSEQDIGYGRDVAERVWAAVERAKAAAALRRSEEEFRTLGENLPNLCWTAKADGRRYWFNRAWFTYTGTKLAEMRGWGWQSVVHPDHLAGVMAHWAQALRSGERFETVIALRGTDGLYRSFLTRVVPVRDGAGTLTRWFGTNVDISAQLEVEQRLRASEAKLRGLNERLEQEVATRTADRDRMWRLSTDIMLVARFDAGITAINPAWTTLLGRTEEELIGRQFVEFVHPDDVAATLREIENLAGGRITLRFENRYRHQDGSYRWVSWTAVPDHTFIHAVGRDVTAEKEAAAQLEVTRERLRQAQRMEALGQLAGGIAHDFNNILQAVSGGLTLIERRAGDRDSVRKLAGMAADAAARGAAITGRLLAFARKDELKAVAVPPEALLEGVREMLTHTLGAEIEIRTRLEADLQPLLADRAQLETVLVNLAVNARDAMPGGGTLTLAAIPDQVVSGSAHRAGLRHGAYVRLVLTDTGRGMDAATLARAGDPFFTTKPVGQGTGLGLAMARGFAEQSGGGFAIESREGEGTTVALWFPVAASARSSVQMDGRTRDAAVLEARGGRILIVDDDPMVRQILAAHLEDHGYAVTQASDGLDALVRIDAGEITDLLITDLSMPGMNGLSLIQETRKRLPDLPVLLMTGYADNDFLARLDDTPVSPADLLRKPVAVETLLARTASVLPGA